MTELIKIDIIVTPTTDGQSILEIETRGIEIADLSEMFDWILHNLRYKDKRKIKRVK